MSEAALDLELVVSADWALTIPPSDLARLSAVPGQRLRVRIERVAPARRTLLGAFVKPLCVGRARLTIDDFDTISDELWSGSGYGSD